MNTINRLSINNSFSANYYKNVVDKRVVIVGLEPPPYGGISVHIKRVAAELAVHNRVMMIDVIKEGWKRSKLQYFLFLIKRLVRYKPQLIYYHTLSMRSGFIELITLLVVTKLFRAQCVLIEHSDRFLYKRSTWYKYILGKLMRFIDQQVLIGKPMLDAYQKNGIWLKTNVLVESAFVEPNVRDEEFIFRQYPHALKYFLQQHAEQKLILMNASKFGLWDGKDIYGFDLCVQLMHDLANLPVKMIIIVGNIYDQAHYEQIRNQINSCSNILLLVNFKHELWPLMKQVNLFVRPSRFDNNSVSVAEAIWLAKPVIASDIAPRPAGTILFKTGDYENFKQQVVSWLHQQKVIYEDKCHYTNAQ